MGINHYLPKLAYISNMTGVGKGALLGKPFCIFLIQ